VNGLIGTKIGMTSIYTATGEYIACTVVEASPNVVTQVKTSDSDGYDALQLSYGNVKVKNVNQARKGHFAKSGSEPMKKSAEFKNIPVNKNLGESIALTEIFKEGDTVHAMGVSKGKGFQGVVKRHGFGGVGGQTHGQHNRGRAPGSLGASSFPSRVLPGMRMGGRMGNNKVMGVSLRVLKLMPEENIIIVKGSVPGPKGGYVIITK